MLFLTATLEPQLYWSAGRRYLCFGLDLLFCHVAFRLHALLIVKSLVQGASTHKVPRPPTAVRARPSPYTPPKGRVLTEQDRSFTTRSELRCLHRNRPCLTTEKKQMFLSDKCLLSTKTALRPSCGLYPPSPAFGTCSGIMLCLACLPA